jgi:hypothetical protein
VPRLICEGIGYFIVLTGKYALLVPRTLLSNSSSGVNVFNLILYRTIDVQNQVSSLHQGGSVDLSRLTPIRLQGKFRDF